LKSIAVLVLGVTVASGCCLAGDVAGDVMGQVVDAATSAPVKGAWVGVAGSADLQPTDESGVYRSRARIGHQSKTVKITWGVSIKPRSEKAIESEPRWVVAGAPGYKPFCGPLRMYWADVRQEKVVLERLCLAPVDGALRSGRPEDTGGPGPSPMGVLRELTVSPTVVTRQPYGATHVSALLDVPAGLPVGLGIRALSSDGRDVQLLRRDTGATSPFHDYTTPLRLPDSAALVEVMVGSVVHSSLSHASTEGFGFLVNAASSLVGAPVWEGFAREGQVFAGSCLVVRAPGASAQEQSAWQALASTTGGTGDSLGAAAALQAVPDGELRRTFCALLGADKAQDLASRRQVAAALEGFIAGKPQEACALVLRRLAMTLTAIAAETGAPDDEAKARAALEATAPRFEKYGPGLRLLADLALTLHAYDLAGKWYSASSQTLGDLDGTVSAVTTSRDFGNVTALFTAALVGPMAALAAQGAGVTGAPDPLAFSVRNARTSTKGRRGDLLARAAECLAQAERANDARGWLSAATALRETGLVSEAERAAQRSIDLEQSAAALNCKGLLAGDRGQNAESLALFSQATAKDAGFAPAWHNLGFTLWREGMIAEAVDPLLTARKLDGKNRRYRTAGDIAEAWRDAQHNPARAERAALMYWLDVEDAIPDDTSTGPALAQAAAVGSSSAWAYWLLGRIALTQPGQEAAAQSHLLKAAQIAPKEPLFPAELMLLCLRAGDKEAAWCFSDLAAEHAAEELQRPADLPDAFFDALKAERAQRLDLVEPVKRLTALCG